MSAGGRSFFARLRYGRLLLLLCVLAVPIVRFIHEFRKATSFSIPEDQQWGIASEMYRLGVEHQFGTLGDKQNRR